MLAGIEQVRPGFAASVLGLGRRQLAELAANGVRASSLDAATKQALVADINAVALDGAGWSREGTVPAGS